MTIAVGLDLPADGATVLHDSNSPIEFDLAHVPEAASQQYPGVDQGLLDDCRQLVLAMVAAWRWDRSDEFPGGRRVGEALHEALRAGPPWPTLDAAIGRQGGPR